MRQTPPVRSLHEQRTGDSPDTTNDMQASTEKDNVKMKKGYGRRDLFLWRNHLS